MNTYYDFTPRPVQEIARPFIDYFFPTFRLRHLKSLPKLDPSKNGQGLVITQCDIVDKTKKKHENTFFVIPPKLVPGSPPVTTTQFDICKDGGLLKKILKKGEKWESTKNPDDVIVKYEARRFDGTLVAKSDKVEFIVKDGHCCFALPKSVKNMKKGEKVILTVKPQYGLGDKGSVPPEATLFYEVFLVSFLKESWEMNTKEKIEAARKKKREGDELKFAEKFARASKKYEKALKFIEDDPSFSDKEKKNIRGLKYDCYMSNAKCKMMLHDNED